MTEDPVTLDVRFVTVGSHPNLIVSTKPFWMSLAMRKSLQVAIKKSPLVAR
jgi:hypothetical protein